VLGGEAGDEGEVALGVGRAGGGLLAVIRDVVERILEVIEGGKDLVHEWYLVLREVEPWNLEDLLKDKK
jgi:hypothetical protein